MKQVEICVLGSANVDYFMYVSHIPVPGQTIQALKSMVANGGKGANQAAAAASLGVKCTFVGQVGNDAEMNLLQKELVASGVHLRWVSLPCETGKALIFVDDHGQNSIVIVGGANMNYASLTVLDQRYVQTIDECGYLLLQKQIPMQINVLAAKRAYLRNSTVILDCGGRDDPIPNELLDHVSYVSPNETQLLRIDPSINRDNLLSELNEKILGKRPKLKILLKLGAKGSAVIGQGLYVECGSVTVLRPQVLQEYSIVDTVGAGDCFTAAYAVKHSQLQWGEGNQVENQRKAMLYANCAAFLCITRKGAMPSMPKKKEVEEFMRKYKLE